MNLKYCLYTGMLLLSIQNLVEARTYSTNGLGCTFSVSIEKESYIELEPIFISISVENNDNDALLSNRILIFKIVDFSIKDEEGKDVKLTNYGMQLFSNLSSLRNGMNRIALKKEMSYSEVLKLNLLYDLSKTGKYYVIANIETTIINNKKRIPYQSQVKFSLSIKSPVYTRYDISKSSENLTKLEQSIYDYDIYTYNITLEKLIKTLDKQINSARINSISQTVDELVKLNLQESIPLFFDNIDFGFISQSQTNYPYFEALKKIGVPFYIFTNELNKAESGTIKEELLNDLGQHSYGDIFPLYLKQLEKNK